LVKATGARWCEARLDQRDLGALRAAADQAHATFSRLDILFANAAFKVSKPSSIGKTQTGTTRST
jgi:NAD(P)-dependent dehydrogenase (short-subunit alcohol dehydrogenase family)